MSAPRSSFAAEMEAGEEAARRAIEAARAAGDPGMIVALMWRAAEVGGGWADGVGEVLGRAALSAAT